MNHFIFALLLFLHSVESQVPVLGQYFEAEVRVDIKVMLTHFRLAGIIKVDKFLPGLYANLYGDDPNNYWGKLNATVVVEPHNQTVIVWDIKNNFCTRYAGYNKTIIPDIALPPSAKRLDDRDCQGKNCQVWRVPEPYQDVTYADIFVWGNSIQTIEAEYTGSSPKAYLTIQLDNILHIHAPTYYFRKPLICDS